MEHIPPNKESVPLLEHSSKVVLHRYLACIACTQSEDSLANSRQANLHWKASLTASALRSTRPPLALGLQIVSHAISGKPFSEGDFFQKKITMNFI